MMPVIKATSADAAQDDFTQHSTRYEKYYYKPASISDYNESQMANYTWMTTKGNKAYLPSWSGGDSGTLIVKWQQVPS